MVPARVLATVSSTLPYSTGLTLTATGLLRPNQKYSPLAVMHFAAYAYVGESVTDPGKYYRNNVGGTVGLVEALRRCGVAHLVFSSTCATYGEPERMPITEDTPQRPVNPYGRSKLMIEWILDDFADAFPRRFYDVGIAEQHAITFAAGFGASFIWPRTSSAPAEG